MLRTIAQCDSQALSRSLFVTLTYPRQFPSDPGIYTRDLDTFSKRLRRTFPHSSALWKLEFQQRGAPHYHLLVMGVPFLARAWLSRAWFAVVNSGDDKHLRAGTQVQRCHSARKACAYAAKYVAKVSDCVPVWHTGRFWGAIGRRSLPAHRQQWRMDRRGHARLSRVIRHLVSSRSKRTPTGGYPPGWCFANGARAAVAVLWAGGEWFPPATLA
jgi:hypothetical protein